jgi:NAD(P) transhydrogenase subunit alpha
MEQAMIAAVVTDLGARLQIGVLREAAEGERRVALTPDGVSRLKGLGLDVVIAAGAGEAAWFDDAVYLAAGARVCDEADIFACDLLLCVGPPKAVGQALLRPGQVLIGLLAPLIDPQLALTLAQAKVTVISLDGLPRTLSRAQSMDALSSQANVAGYKAALVGADTYGSYFPMLMTAAGTIRPATVLVVGAGVAGLQAIGTARRLGAIVTGYDVREAARADVLSLGAKFLDLDSASAGAPVSASGAGGYARELTEQEKATQQTAMVSAVASFDVVITTAQVPGRRPPVLISAAAVAGMQAGSVIVDLAASQFGGNVDGSQPGQTTVTGNGVTIIGAPNLAAEMPRAASVAYSRNMCALLAHLVKDSELVLDAADEITAGVLISHDGAVVHPGVLARLAHITTTTEGQTHDADAVR